MLLPQTGLFMSNRARRTSKSRVQLQHERDAKVSTRRRQLAIGVLVVGAALTALLIVLISSNGDDTGGNEPDLAFNGVNLPAFTGNGPDPAVGLKAPLFVTEDLEGNRVVTGGGGGPNDTAKVVIFVAHWCPTCQREVPRLAQWFATQDLPDGVEIVTVSTFPDPNRDNYPPSEWFASVGWPTPVLRDSGDGKIAASFGMSSVPGWVVLDDTNFVLARASGGLTDDDFSALVDLASTGT